MTNTSNSAGDQAKTLRDLNSFRSSNKEIDVERATAVYSITSGKGGVGKTAVCANLAYNLASIGKRVLILDADLGLANIDVVFGLSPAYNMNHFFSGEQDLQNILVDGPLGIKILPAGSGIQNFTRLDSNQKMRLLDGLDSMQNHFQIAQSQYQPAQVESPDSLSYPELRENIIKYGLDALPVQQTPRNNEPVMNQKQWLDSMLSS